jgi:hypothetical protein
LKAAAIAKAGPERFDGDFLFPQNDLDGARSRKFKNNPAAGASVRGRPPRSAERERKIERQTRSVNRKMERQII